MKFLFILLVLVSSIFANIGTIMVTKGEAVVERSIGNVEASAGLALEEGDVIVTQAKSRVQVMLKDETVVTVGSKSKFSFDEYILDGENSKVQMTASRGFFRSVTGRIGKLAPQRFKVKTASATIGIRGTDFWGITGGKIEIVTCNKGAITIEFEGQTIEVAAGQYASYGENGVEQGESSDNSGEETSQEDSSENSEEEESGEDNTLEETMESDALEVNVPTEDIADLSPNQILNGLTVDGFSGADRPPITY